MSAIKVKNISTKECEAKPNCLTSERVSGAHQGSGTQALWGVAEGHGSV